MGRHSIPDPEDSADEPENGPVGGADSWADDERYRAEPTEGFVDDDEHEDRDDDRGLFDADDTEDAPSAFAAQPSSGGRPDPEWTGSHRIDTEWTGSHRTVTPGRRGVSLGVIAALVTVVVVVAGVIGWQFFGDALSNRSNSGAARCLDGEITVSVLADPAIADNVSGFAKKFNESAGPVGDHCVSVKVAPADSDAVVSGFVGEWPANLGDKPALWIPGSSVAPARLQAADGPKVVSASTSLATSPVLLAVRPELKTALAQQNWSTLPGLQTDQAALEGLGLPGWGSLRLALPRSGDSDASYLAAEAVASASAPAGAPATDGAPALARLVAAQPKLPGDSLDEAMKALLGDDPAAAPVHAVAITEQQLFTRANAAGADSTLAGWLPPGPVAVADFPAVLLAGDWVSEEQAAAASEFERFLTKPEQLTELSKAGFRTQGATMPQSSVTPFGALPETLSVGDDSVRVAIANALSVPASDSATSIMLDRSLNIGSVAAALKARIGALPSSSAVGLTTFDGSESTSQVPLGTLSDPVDGTPRSQRLDAALDGLTPSGGGAVSFTTLRNVYADALTNFRAGQNNSVLVITAGPHTDQSLDSAGLQELIRSSADPARPVAVDIINVGDDPDSQTWQSVAQISGGTYQNVPNSDSPEFVNALNALLG